MAFFNKVGETISSKSKNIAAKAKELAEVSSLNGQVSSQEEIIERAYLEMGKKYYELHKDAPEEMYASQCTIINESSKKIEELQDEIRKIKGIQVCIECGAEITAEASFCPKCGAKVVIPETKQESETTSDGDVSTNGQEEQAANGTDCADVEQVTETKEAAEAESVIEE